MSACELSVWKHTPSYWYAASLCWKINNSTWTKNLWVITNTNCDLFIQHFHLSKRLERPFWSLHLWMIYSVFHYDCFIEYLHLWLFYSAPPFINGSILHTMWLFYSVPSGWFSVHKKVCTTFDILTNIFVPCETSSGDYKNWMFPSRGVSVCAHSDLLEYQLHKPSDVHQNNTVSASLECLR